MLGEFSKLCNMVTYHGPMAAAGLINNTDNYTLNSGAMLGDFDFCDISGGAIDINPVLLKVVLHSVQARLV